MIQLSESQEEETGWEGKELTFIAYPLFVKLAVTLCFLYAVAL